MSSQNQADMKDNTICSRCVMDFTVPDIKYDSAGVCNYCYLHNVLDKAFPNDENEGERLLGELADKIRSSKSGKYDCVLGVSGGTDSTYLLHWAKLNGLSPLAFHLDNGWNSDISVQNIRKSISKLGVDFETYVIDWEEIKDILASFLRASFAWADIPTDIAITSSLYRIAAKEKIKYILVGNNFRTEGKQPLEWTYGDGRMVNAVCKKYGRLKKHGSYPNLTVPDLMYYGILKGVKLVRPFYHMRFNKKEAQKMLEKEYGWTNYGGHHHESIFTRFIIGYWLPRKFDIDKRKVTLSALVRSGEISRENALSLLREPPYALDRMESDREYVIKKLGLAPGEFERMMKSPNTCFRDFPSYYPLFEKYRSISKVILKLVFSWDIPTLHKIEMQ